MRPAILFATLAVLSVTSGTAAAQTLTARTVRFTSAALGGQATFAVLVPAGYDSAAKRYPVVYLLHGGTQNHTAFAARSWFAREVTKRDLIAVMPHVPPFAYNGAAGRSLPVEAFVAELVQHVDATYRTVASREARAIAGLSMGGFGAVVAGFARSDLFATVGAFSGAFGSGREARLAAAAAALPRERAPFFYLACGVADPALSASRGLAAVLAAREIPHQFREVPGAHTWEVWDPQTLAFIDMVTARPGFAPTS